jgi:hypothetical protein
VVDPRSELAAVLCERGVLETTTALVAAWPGRLLRLDGAGVGAQADDNAEATAPMAVLGVTRNTAHLLSSFGVLNFALVELTAAHSGRPGHLGLDVAPAVGTRIVIDLTIERPVAVASQLNEMRVVAASDEAGQLGPDS